MQSPFSIIFCGTSPFAVPSLERLAADPAFKILLVVTQPDRPAGRKKTLTPPAVKISAEKLGLPIFQPENINKEFAELQKKADRPDFLVVVSFGQILSQAVLDFPTIAPVNVHASLLPRWRGASPLQQTILAGDTEGGVTIQKIVRELDAGPVLAQDRLDLSPRETTITLHDKLAQMGANLLVRTLKNPLDPQEQDLSQITLCGKLSREDGKADPATETAEAIDRKVRALTPWPGVSMKIDGQDLKILETSLEPGTEAYGIDCAEASTLYVHLVQAAGKKPVSGVAWARGQKGSMAERQEV